jgi:peroxiredoxin
MRAKFMRLVIVAGFCALFSMRMALATDAIVVGQAAPALVTPTLDARTFDLASLKGKVVVVHFWATWCMPCREEMPALEAVWRQYHSKGFEVLAVSADRPRARADVAQVMQYFTFPAASLGSITKNDFGTPTSIPITYVIDKSGNIQQILTPDVSPLTEHGLGEEIKALLEGKSEAAKSDAKP